MKFLTEPEDWLTHPEGYEVLVAGQHGPEWTVIGRDAGNRIVAQIYEVRGSVRGADIDLSALTAQP